MLQMKNQASDMADFLLFSIIVEVIYELCSRLWQLERQKTATEPLFKGSLAVLFFVTICAIFFVLLFLTRV